MTPITVLLAEDHIIVREGLKALLELEDDIQVVGESGDGRETVALAKELRPSVVIMDVAMPRLNGLEATRQILQALPATRVLILSAHSDDAYVEQSLAYGAAGYLIKQTASRVLLNAVREVHQGHLFLSPSIAARRDRHQKRSLERGELISKKGAVQLTSREVEVLQLIAEGKTNKEIGEELHISVKTVEKHRQRLMEKLNIHDTAGLTRHAIAAGIIESSVQVTITEE